MAVSHVKKNRSLCIFFLLNFWYFTCGHWYLVRLLFSFWVFKVFPSIQVVELSMCSCLPFLSLAVLHSPCGLLEVHCRCWQLASCEKMAKIKRSKPFRLYRNKPYLGLPWSVTLVFIHSGHRNKLFLDFLFTEHWFWFWCMCRSVYGKIWKWGAVSLTAETTPGCLKGKVPISAHQWLDSLIIFSHRPWCIPAIASLNILQCSPTR